jgi:hypothetical protein
MRGIICCMLKVCTLLYITVWHAHMKKKRNLAVINTVKYSKNHNEKAIIIKHCNTLPNR